MPDDESPDRIRKAVQEAMASRSPDDPIRRAWTLVAEGGMGAVRTALTSLPDSGDADAAVHRFLLLNLAGEVRSVALTPLRRALAEGLPVAGSLLALLGPGELEEIVRSPEARWEFLSLQVEEDAAARLFRLRCRDAIVRDEVSSVAVDLQFPGFEAATATRPQVDLAAREALAALAWEDPGGARRLAAALGPCEPSNRGLAALLMAAVRCAAQRSRFLAEEPGLGVFDRFLRLAPVSPVDRGVAMARDVGADFAEKPGRYARAFHRLAREGPDLFAHYAGLAMPLHRPDPSGVRVERNRVEVLRRAEAALRDVPFRRISFLSNLFCGRRGSSRVWDGRLREPVAVALADHPAPPDEVAAHAGRWFAPWGLRGFRIRIRSDELLWVIWWTACLKYADAAATGV